MVAATAAVGPRSYAIRYRTVRPCLAAFAAWEAWHSNRKAKAAAALSLTLGPADAQQKQLGRHSTGRRGAADPAPLPHPQLCPVVCWRRRARWAHGAVRLPL